MRIFRNYANSFDHFLVAKTGCSPFNVVVVLVVSFGILSAIETIPSLKSSLNIKGISLPVLLIALGGLFSVASWKAYPNRTFVSLFQFFDISFYSSALISLSALTSPPFSYYFCAIWIVSAVYWATAYGYTFLGTLSLLIGPTIILTLYDSEALLYISVCLGAMLWFFISRVTAEKNAQKRRAIRILSSLDNVIDDQQSPATADAQRLKLISVFHKAKNDLTPAQWNIEYLEKTIDFNEENQTVLKETKECIESTLKCLFEYLEKYRSQISENRFFMLSDLILSLKNEFVSKTQLKLHIKSEENVMIDGRLYDFQLAINILIENAIDAGSKCISLKETQSPDSNSVQLILEDDGPGLPSVVKERLFKPFNTFGKRKGVGLGLYLAYRLVSAHGGSLSLVESSTKGTTFSLDLLNRSRKMDGAYTH